MGVHAGQCSVTTIDCPFCARICWHHHKRGRGWGWETVLESPPPWLHFRLPMTCSAGCFVSRFGGRHVFRRRLRLFLPLESAVMCCTCKDFDLSRKGNPNSRCSTGSLFGRSVWTWNPISLGKSMPDASCCQVTSSHPNCAPLFCASGWRPVEQWPPLLRNGETHREAPGKRERENDFGEIPRQSLTFPQWCGTFWWHFPLFSRTHKKCKTAFFLFKYGVCLKLYYSKI